MYTGGPLITEEDIIIDEHIWSRGFNGGSFLWQVSSSSKTSSPKRRKRLDTSSHTNYRYLHTPELRLRLKNSRNQNKVLNRKIDQLKRKIDRMTQLDGITLDESLSSDLCAIASASQDKITHPPDSFARIFWDQQRESMRKNAKQMHWHPMMIKWCIHLRMLSSSCYNSIRSSGWWICRCNQLCK